MHKRNGFTVVELLVVIVVIAILATIGGLAWRSSRNNAVETSRKGDIIALKSAIEKYYQDNGEYPWPNCGSTFNWHRECYGTELATLLVPNYMEKLPVKKSAGDLNYAAQKLSGSNDGFIDRYSLRVVLPDGSTCKTGKNMRPEWWGSAPPCDF